MWSASFCVKEAKQVEQTFCRLDNIKNRPMSPPYHGCDGLAYSETLWDQLLLHSSHQSNELTRKLPELVQHLRL
jgi:hypothetical protein